MPGDSNGSPASDDLRVLLLAPTRRDAEAIGTILSGESINCIAFATMDALCGAMNAGVGAVMVSEESLVELQTKASQEVANVLTGKPPRNPVNPDVLQSTK